MQDFNLIEALTELDRLQELTGEELQQSELPAEVAALIQQGVPVYKEEPNFIKQEVALTEQTS